jgi:hypothetical protein
VKWHDSILQSLSRDIRSGNACGGFSFIHSFIHTATAIFVDMWPTEDFRLNAKLIPLQIQYLTTCSVTCESISVQLEFNKVQRRILWKCFILSLVVYLLFPPSRIFPHLKLSSKSTQIFDEQSHSIEQSWRESSGLLNLLICLSNDTLHKHRKTLFGEKCK